MGGDNRGFASYPKCVLGNGQNLRQKITVTKEIMSRQIELKPRVRKLLKKGIAHQQAGRRERAEACYRSSLKADPRCPQTLHLLGLLAQQAGDYRNLSSGSSKR